MKAEGTFRSRRRFIAAVGVLVLAMGVIVLAGPVGAGTDEESAPHDDTLPDGVVYQSSDEALAADHALFADAAGLDVRAVGIALAFREEFDEFALSVYEEHKDRVAGFWADRVPAMQGHIRFVDEIPADVAANVASNGLPITLTGHNGIQIDMHYRRSVAAAIALADTGFDRFTSAYNLEANVIKIEFWVPAGSAHPDAAEVLAAVRVGVDGAVNQAPELFSPRGADVRGSDIKISVVADRAMIKEHTRGGNELLDDGEFECTSGWSVDGGASDGVATAAHCHGLNKFK